MIKSLLSNYWGSVGRGMFVCCMYEYYNVFFRIFKVYMSRTGQLHGVVPINNITSITEYGCFESCQF